jgi:hypothetical protein
MPERVTIKAGMQGGFPSSVLSNHRVDFSLFHGDVHVVQRFYAGELFGNGVHLQ